MTVLRVVQVLWALFLLLVVGLAGLFSGTPLGIAVFVLFLVYALAALVALGTFRVAWWVVVIIPWIPGVYVGVNAAYNFVMFAGGHELYQDSPATIIVVGINALLFCAPPLLIYLLMLVNRSEIARLLRSSR